MLYDLFSSFQPPLRPCLALDQREQSTLARYLTQKNAFTRAADDQRSPKPPRAPQHKPKKRAHLRPSMRKPALSRSQTTCRPIAKHATQRTDELGCFRTRPPPVAWAAPTPFLLQYLSLHAQRYPFPTPMSTLEGTFFAAPPGAEHTLGRGPLAGRPRSPASPLFTPRPGLTPTPYPTSHRRAKRVTEPSPPDTTAEAAIRRQENGDPGGEARPVEPARPGTEPPRVARPTLANGTTEPRRADGTLSAPAAAASVPADGSLAHSQSSTSAWARRLSPAHAR